ncbi:26501_t:CDS:2 [Racocetra persica]|uniref:26501_t:CDS:1 n=1 Tax=Racocetra persica TaxID=160502 RepID=A0ACA9L8S8_9GLOM|nr:26501_t:CDS:2 [Racocetra persica]
MNVLKKITSKIEQKDEVQKPLLKQLLENKNFYRVVKSRQYSYLYIEPYEPVEHGTFGVDQSNWNIIALRIKDIFAGIMAGCRGFEHPDYDGVVPY